jgi:hypothetical protein
MPSIKVYFSIRWLTGRGYVERGPNDVDSVFPLFADVPSYRLTRPGWGVALFHLAKNRVREHPAMKAARLEYANDLDGMTDREIEHEINDAEETISEAESWLEALIAERDHRK